MWPRIGVNFLGEARRLSNAVTASTRLAALTARAFWRDFSYPR